MFRIRLFGENKWGPLRQAFLVTCLSLLMSIMTRSASMESETAFIFIVSPMLLYCALNPVLSVFTHSFKPYLAGSFVLFSMLITFNFWMAKWVTGVHPFDNYSMKMMYVLMIFFYFMIYIAAMLFRGARLFIEDGDQMR